MNAQNNAARVAVQAEPCSKQAASLALPTWQQSMALALAYAQNSLEHLVQLRCDDEDWNEDDVDVDLAIDLALLKIKEIRANPPAGIEDFEHGWYMAGAAVNLGMHAFSRHDSAYFRWLESVQRQFHVLVAMVEFAQWQANTRLPAEPKQEGA